MTCLRSTVRHRRADWPSSSRIRPPLSWGPTRLRHIHNRVVQGRGLLPLLLALLFSLPLSIQSTQQSPMPQPLNPDKILTFQRRQSTHKAIASGLQTPFSHMLREEKRSVEGVTASPGSDFPKPAPDEPIAGSEKPRPWSGAGRGEGGAQAGGRMTSPPSRRWSTLVSDKEASWDNTANDTKNKQAMACI